MPEAQAGGVLPGLQVGIGLVQDVLHRAPYECPLASFLVERIRALRGEEAEVVALVQAANLLYGYEIQKPSVNQGVALRAHGYGKKCVLQLPWRGNLVQQGKVLDERGEHCGRVKLFVEHLLAVFLPPGVFVVIALVGGLHVGIVQAERVGAGHSGVAGLPGNLQPGILPQKLVSERRHRQDAPRDRGGDRVDACSPPEDVPVCPVHIVGYLILLFGSFGSQVASAVAELRVERLVYFQEFLAALRQQASLPGRCEQAEDFVEIRT